MAPSPDLGADPHSGRGRVSRWLYVSQILVTLAAAILMGVWINAYTTALV